MRCVLLGVVVVACSTPPSKPHEVYTPPDDDGSAVAYHKAHPPPPAELTFDWDKIRADNEQWLSTPLSSKNPCDPRWTGAKPQGTECIPLPGGPRVQIAARKRLTRSPTDLDHVEVTVDRGSDATITKDWFAVILDAAGHPRKPWVHPDRVEPGVTVFTVTTPLEGSGSWDHVVLVERMPE